MADYTDEIKALQKKKSYHNREMSYHQTEYLRVHNLLQALRIKQRVNEPNKRKYVRKIGWAETED